ncbi:MAG: hypothetical protein JO257_37545 [Deltaproteobacteria bacterium]|nr:hypothetical protein [Deltaproteobacteria bacterium]
MSRWVVLAMIAACGHAAKPAPQPPPGTTHAAPVDAPARPPALEDDLARLADRAVRFYADWQQVMAGVGTDCAAATAKINALADANADFIAANAKVIQQGHDKVVALRQALEPHATELDASAKAIVQAPAMAACHDDAGFAHAIDRIQGDAS